MTAPPEQDVVAALAAQQDEMAGLLDGLDAEGWAAQSRCEAWSVSDVVLHMAQSNELAVASVHGEFDAVLAELTASLPSAGSVDEGADVMVAAQRHLGPEEIHRRWLASAAAQADAFEAVDPHARVQWVLGDMAARTLCTTRLSETWIHTGDVAFGLGVELPPTDRLKHVVRLAWRTLPHAFARDGRSAPGPVAFHLIGPDGERWDIQPDDPALSVISGPAAELCEVAAQRVAAAETSLVGEGPDARSVLALVRTWA